MSKNKNSYVRDMGKLVSKLYENSWESAIKITERDIDYSERGDRRVAGIIALTIFRATIELGASYVPVFHESDF